jgi:hypothetical protein
VNDLIVEFLGEVHDAPASEGEVEAAASG